MIDFSLNQMSFITVYKKFRKAASAYAYAESMRSKGYTSDCFFTEETGGLEVGFWTVDAWKETE